VKRLLIICGLAALLLVPAAFAAHAQPLSFISNNHANFAAAVSQQPGVVNPLRAEDGAAAACGWDQADAWQRQAVLNSSLAGGATATDRLCLYQDTAARVVYAQLASPSSGLSVRLTMSDGLAAQAQATWDQGSRTWVYRACFPVDTFASGPEVAGSNGGWAVTTTATLSVTNPSGKSASGITALWGYEPPGSVC
jgi:opacity protein-like surface antigen